MYLFTDTETTGFPRNGANIQDDQARVCQSAIILTDSKGKTISQFSTLLKPDGWEIGKGAQKVHGISQSECEKYGTYQRIFLNVFRNLSLKAEYIVAHNKKFDSRMMDIESAYGGALLPETPWLCTMETNTHLADGRWPKLDKTLYHYTGRRMVNAHDAMADTIACKDIFFAMRDLNLIL